MRDFRREKAVDRVSVARGGCAYAGRVFRSAHSSSKCPASGPPEGGHYVLSPEQGTEKRGEERDSGRPDQHHTKGPHEGISDRVVDRCAVGGTNRNGSIHIGACQLR